jgi:DNA modification methylase
MTPYYETKLGKLYHGDCLEIMPKLEQVDLVLTDPPYGINWIPRTNHREQIWIDDKQFDPRPFLPIGKQHCFWGGNYFAHLLPPTQGWATWVKRPIHAGVEFKGNIRNNRTCVDGLRQKPIHVSRLGWRETSGRSCK